MGIHSFDDFDAWANAVQGADLRLVCTGVETPLWQIAVRPIGPVILQSAYEGGGNLAYGAATHSGTTLMIDNDPDSRQTANGEPIDAGAVFVIEPGADFAIRALNRAHSWSSVTLPPSDAAERSGTVPRSSRVVRPGVGAVDRLRTLANAMATAPSLGADDGPAHASAARQIIAAATACLGPPERPRRIVGRPRIDRATIIRLAQGVMDIQARPTVADLALSIGVSERTLHRAFLDTYGVGPREYLALRLLYSVRRSLRKTGGGGETVSRILTRHGIWEFGRFAGRYRRQFGESLSDTLRASG